MSAQHRPYVSLFRCVRLSRFALSGTAIALCAAAAPAAAAPSSSSVLVTSFSYTTSGAALTWSDPYQSFSASVLAAGGLLGADSDELEAENYQFAIAGASIAALSAAVSTTTPQTFWATAGTAASNGLATYLPNKAEAIAGQSGTFMLSGAGTVSFTVGYELAVSAPGGNPVSDYGSANLAFLLGDGDGSSGGGSNAGITSFSQASGIGLRTGSFTFSVNLAAGEPGFYSLQGNALAFSTASVPEPSAGWLLACGLASMAAWVRPRRPQARTGLRAVGPAHA